MKTIAGYTNTVGGSYLDKTINTMVSRSVLWEWATKGGKYSGEGRVKEIRDRMPLLYPIKLKLDSSPGATSHGSQVNVQTTMKRQLNSQDNLY